jgi:hypothetical protein
VLEQLLSEKMVSLKIVLVKTILLLSQWLKVGKTGTSLTVKEQENLVNGLLPVKIPMFLLKNPPSLPCG